MWRDVIEAATPTLLLVWWGVIVVSARDNKVRRRRRVEFRLVVDTEPLLRSLREMQAAIGKAAAAMAEYQRRYGG